MSESNPPTSVSFNKEQRRKKLLVGLGGIVVVSLVGASAYWLLHGSKLVSTDNAYAAVEIAPVTPSFGGTISAGYPVTAVIVTAVLMAPKRWLPLSLACATGATRKGGLERMLMRVVWPSLPSRKR